MLEDRILEFSRLLRKGGVNISVTQITSAMEAVSQVGMAPNDFHTALLSTLITDQMDQPLFDKLFRLFYITLAQDGCQGPFLISAEKERINIPSDLAKSIEGKGMGRGAGASPYLLLVKAVREEDYYLLHWLAQMGIESLDSLEQEAVIKMDDLVFRVKVSIGWYQAVNTLERIRLREEVGEATYLRWQSCLSYLERYIESQLEDLFVKKYGKQVLEEIAVVANIREKEFNKLEYVQIVEIRKRIGKLARKMATKHSRRFRRAKRGEIDLRRTVREALVTGGAPIRLKYKKKVISKPELVLLCDVSGSVALFSDFMLQLVYTIQNRFSYVRSFLFVNTIDEVTEYFKNIDLQEALKKSFAQARYAMSPFSDYGRVFRHFAEEYLPIISKQCTLIILGDARNNYNLDQREFLQKIQEHVRRILWFNPQPREAWNTEDSIMNIYAPYCRQVFECRNLNQLESVIEAIL